MTDKKKKNISIEKKILASMDAGTSTGIDPMIGKKIDGKYIIKAKIGAGGMGTVYKAHHPEIDREVAIKFMPQSQANDATALKRFHIEALAVSKLSHPHTIQIFDFGKTADDNLYIVMELLRGKSLKDFLRENMTIAVKLVLKIAREIAESLREAHSKGIIHRDLKPDNIFLVPVGDDPNFVKVLDFGVAKLKQGYGEEGTVTKTGMIFGTPKYMSPEQASSLPVDKQSDIYSLGCIMYEMLLGQPPFVGDSAISILFKHVNERPTPIDMFRPDIVVPYEVELLVMKMLAKKPANRIADSSQLIKIIDWLNGKLSVDFDRVVFRKDKAKVSLLDDLGQAMTEPDTFIEEILNKTSFGDELEQGTVQKQVPKTKHVKSIALVTIIVMLSILIGAYFVMFKNNFSPSSKQVALIKLKRSKFYDKLLPKVKKTIIKLNTSPTGALIFANGLLRGKTPVMVSGLPDHSKTDFVFKIDKYKDKKISVNFIKNRTLNVILEPEKKQITKKPIPNKTKQNKIVKTLIKKTNKHKKPVQTKIKIKKVKDFKSNPYD